MWVGTMLRRFSMVSASMKPMPGISHPESSAADRENELLVPRPPVANAGRTHPGLVMSVVVAGQVVACSEPLVGSLWGASPVPAWGWLPLMLVVTSGAGPSGS